MEKFLFSSLDDKDCELINYTDNARRIHWQKYGTDFLLDGEEYDVVKSKNINGKVYLYCITDTKEHELLSHISTANGTRHTDSATHEVSSLDEFTITEMATIINRDDKKQYPALDNNFLAGRSFKIIEPPPFHSFS